jgi:DNA-binding transcriptional regulator LsrR (DeoR family)
MPVKVVQLVGALGAREQEYDGNVVVQRMAKILMGEAFYLNAPFVVDSIQTAKSLRAHQAIRETLELAKHSDIALFGIGTTSPAEYSSFYRSGYIKPDELERLQFAGAVGDVCGYHFDEAGNICEPGLSERTIAIDREALLAVPVRLAVAGGNQKISALRGALRAGYINVLVTEKQAAEGVLS